MGLFLPELALLPRSSSPGPAAVTGSHPTQARLPHTPASIPLPRPFSSPGRFSALPSCLISRWFSAHGPVFGPAVPKDEGLQEGGGSRGSGHHGLREGSSHVYALIPPNCQPSSRQGSTYLGPWIIPTPAPGAGVPGPESPSRKSAEGLWARSSGEGPRCTLLGDAKNCRVFYRPPEAAILLDQSQKKMIFVVAVE